MKPYRALAVLSLVGCAACASAAPRGDGGPGAVVSGSYSGRLVVDGQPFQTTMRARTGADGRVSGSFQILSPIPIDGTVRGQIVEGLLRLTITYRDAEGCDGRIQGILDVEPGGDALSGPVTLEDCGAPVAGTISLRR